MEYRGINYTINRAKRKNMYICIQNGEVIVKLPLKVSEKRAKEIIEEKYDWIKKKIVESPVKQPKTYMQGEKYIILGNEFLLNIVYYDKKKSNIIQDLIKRSIDLYLPKKYKDIDEQLRLQEIKKQIEKLYFSVCEQEVEAAMQFITSQVGLYPKEYRVRRLKRAWGNCSSTHNITINVNLATHTRRAIEYVVLHEICHLKYLNHSKNFWNMVSYYMPDYKTVKKELKQY